MALAAQASAAAVVSGAARTVTVEQGPLGPAVDKLGRSFGVTIVFSAADLANLKAQAFSGTAGLDEALDRILAGTGLRHRTLADGSVIVEPVAASSGVELSEVVVTAQKRSQLLSRVPISAVALSGAQMERQGVKDISDIARLVPGLVLQGTDDLGDTDISIRGIISTVGAPTTGVYINDVPIQVRQDGGVWSNPYPKIFDLDRVEVLRGPQGTLFGGSAEGGVVRFITPDASLTKASGFFRSEVDATAGGDPSYELGGAFGAPIVEDVLGYRGSLWFRQDGGWAKRVDPATGATLGKDVNESQSAAGKLDFKWRPTDRLTISPSLFVQDIQVKDAGLFWEREPGDYTIASRIPSPHRDRFALGTITADYDFGPVELKSISAAIYRMAHFTYDSTQYEFASYLPDQVVLPSDPSYLVKADYQSSQQSYSQELRLQSKADANARFSWTSGLFYQHEREGYDGTYRDNFNELATYLNGAPTTSLDYFGEAPVDGKYSFVRHYVDEVSEAAAFGDVTWRINSRLKAAAGVRVAKNSFSYTDFQDGPWGPGVPTTLTGSKSETPVTPRFNLSYDIDADRMVYASAAKGYRMGGVNQPVPSSVCQTDLNALGLTSAPTTYNSDSLWSYEAGLKGRFADRTVQLSSSVYWIDWSQIQQSVYLSNCGYGYIANLGKAASRGFDLQLEWSPIRSLTLSGATGMTDASFTQSTLQDGVLLAKKGDPLATPEWTANVSGEYRFRPTPLSNGFARIDLQWADGYRRMGSDDVFGVDPLIRDQPSTLFLSARVGVKFGRTEIDLFGSNLTNSKTSLNRYRDSVDSTPLALRDERPRPLTVGAALRVAY